MRNIMKISPLGAALLCLMLTTHAKAEAPAADAGNLDFTESGDAKLNGVVFTEGASEKPADVYAEVVKTIQGPEGTVLYLHPIEARKTNKDGAIEKIPVSGEARPFEPEASWKMFDAEGEITTDAAFAARVIMPYPLDPGQASIDVIWDECDGSITGNYTGLPCNKHRGLSDDYMAYLKQNYLPTVNDAMAAAGLSPAVSVHIVHDGTTADARHNKGSLHSAGRAIDVQIVTTVDAKGGTNTFDFRKTNTDHRLSHSCAPAGTQLCKFFEAFRVSWGKKQVARRCPGRSGGPIGTIGWEDKDHIAHHLHTSYPFCPNNKGYFITKSGK
ncbi:MAG: hypothetical protein ACXVB9_01025 [Bdellovibrionota bacterium]